MVSFRRLLIVSVSLGVFLASTPAFGQGTPAGPRPPAAPQTAEARLDQILNLWEQVTRQVTAFEAVCNRTRTSVVSGRRRSTKGVCGSSRPIRICSTRASRCIARRTPPFSRS